MDFVCASGIADYYGYCNFLRAKGIDGLSMGLHFKIPMTSGGAFYCAGFHEENFSDTWHCMDENDEDATNYYCGDYYTVTDTYFTTGAFDCWSDDIGYYGLGTDRRFYENHWGIGNDGTDFSTKAVWRFVGAQENDWNRYSVGDELNMFFLDYEHTALTENASFVLAGASQLVAASGVALLTVVLM